jgi:pimeloyl-ACP methyl ester carboxylesterase
MRKRENQYWIFEPADPKPQSAPVIVFNHGWGATNPRVYGAWIKHIVRRGNIVIYPAYQDLGTWRYPPLQITPNAIRAVKDAIARLQSGQHIHPNLDKFAIVEHSAGGQITANMAASAGSVGLPVPKAVMCVQPGKSWTKLQRMAIPLEDVSTIPGDALLLSVVGDKDEIVRDIDAKSIFYGATQIPSANKDFVIVVSDDHGQPELQANHFAPAASDSEFQSPQRGDKRPTRRESPLIQDRLRRRAERPQETSDDDFPDLTAQAHLVDALDFYGFWKLFDGLCDAAFYGINREYALGNTPAQRFMGTWSDGTPVKELKVTDTP